jgi:hypothetical protein
LADLKASAVEIHSEPAALSFTKSKAPSDHDRHAGGVDGQTIGVL